MRAASCALTLLAGLLVAGPALAQRMAVTVECNPADKPLVYDCTLTLAERDSGRMIVGAAAIVEADMPSMPMAHKIKPVELKATDKPGVYTFRIELEMHGEWALKLRLSKPRMDLIVHKMNFAKPPG
jgi:hypothetical protein